MRRVRGVSHLLKRAMAAPTGQVIFLAKLKLHKIIKQYFDAF
jgi:hypothetical protein